MANEFSTSSVHLDVDSSGSRTASEVSPDTPFRILVVGDFSGRANRQVTEPLERRRAYVIDRDNFDTVLQSLMPSLKIGSVTLGFRTLDDFHPDEMLKRVPAFSKLAALRSQGPPTSKEATSSRPIPSNILDEILQHSPDQNSVDLNDAADLATFIKKITAAHVEARPDAAKREWASQIDATRSDLLRALLHHEAFQSLEASWRGLAMLVDRLDTDGPLKIHLFDATLEELIANEEQLIALFARKDEPWGVVVGAFAFSQTDTDAARLERLARAAGRSRVPFVAEATPPSAETSSAWQDFRHSPSSAWIGLAMPRFLLRLPYGPQTSPLDTFSFEEMPRQDHSSYLWGNPAFCCAYLLGLAFLSDGWQMRPGLFTRVEDLPVHTYEQDGETVAKPCAEVLLTERQADFIMDQGFMPLATLKGSDSAILVRFQSVSEPAAALQGRWASGV
jgi:type VI secretion system protein ImpC